MRPTSHINKAFSRLELKDDATLSFFVRANYKGKPMHMSVSHDLSIAHSDTLFERFTFFASNQHFRDYGRYFLIVRLFYIILMSHIFATPQMDNE